MEVQHIIKAGEKVLDNSPTGPFLNVSEFFFDTIQGEGRFVGAPAAFLRLQGCPVNCRWCDTAEVWKKGSRVSIQWILRAIEDSGLKEKLLDSSRIYHLVITGGSPLLQQAVLDALFELMNEVWGCTPFIEVENECSIVPEARFAEWVSCWNNSPKLSSSGVPEEKRVNLEACMEVERLARENHALCFWKFVVKDQADVDELIKTYSGPYWTFNPWKVYLMPMGASQEEYFANREKVVELAIKNGFMYSPREHIAIWNQKTGI